MDTKDLLSRMRSPMFVHGHPESPQMDKHETVADLNAAALLIERQQQALDSIVRLGNASDINTEHEAGLRRIIRSMTDAAGNAILEAE